MTFLTQKIHGKLKWLLEYLEVEINFQINPFWMPENLHRLLEYFSGESIRPLLHVGALLFPREVSFATKHGVRLFTS